MTESKVSREELYKDDDSASWRRGHCATAFAKIDHRTHTGHGAEILTRSDSRQGDEMRDPHDTYMNYLVPMVVEQTNRGERAYTVLFRGF